ncbi:MAG: hypothetical protein RBS09_09000 [Anaerolineaceae bacterium]|nr:hypothetical protein [Anaerolineaceae bacterium]
MCWNMKRTSLIVITMIWAPVTGWAGANTNNPYCEHDPLCYVAIDDVTFFGPGASCCQPKYSSDCKIESITAGTAVRYAWNRFQSWGRAAGAVDAMQMECDLGWDPRYVGPPSNRDWMRDPGGGDPCKAAEVWKEREKERKREYDEAVVEAKRTEQEYNNCVYCKGK